MRPLAVRYKLNAKLRAQDLREIFKASGLKRPVGDLKRLKKMAENHDLTVTAWDGERIVGIARAVTDFAWCAYVSDLGVVSEYQKKGIGREMLRLMRAHLGDGVMVLLLENVNARGYYAKVGFEHAPHAWRVPRKK